VGSIVRLFGLLHTAAGESNTANLTIDNESLVTELYVRNAITLWRSLDRSGIVFTLICSEPDRVSTLCRRFGAPGLSLQEIDFPLEIPSGIPFYSAHHKLDLFRHLGSLPEGEYVGVVDLDMIALGEPPPGLAEIVDRGTPLAYDITHQMVPAFGRDALAGDLETLAGIQSDGRWLGGELLAGRPSFFRALREVIDGFYGVYLREWPRFHHQGDEILTSAAIARLDRCGVEIADAGPLAIVTRYWSNVPRHPQPRFDALPHPFLLHLPADKQFLATLHQNEQIDAERFLLAYRRHLRRRGVPNLARRVLGRWRNAAR
jgi:hypothetical protein